MLTHQNSIDLVEYIIFLLEELYRSYYCSNLDVKWEEFKIIVDTWNSITLDLENFEENTEFYYENINNFIYLLIEFHDIYLNYYLQNDIIIEYDDKIFQYIIFLLIYIKILFKEEKEDFSIYFKGIGFLCDKYETFYFSFYSDLYRFTEFYVT